MDSIFTESSKYENDYLLKILRSLIQVTYQCLQNTFSQDNKKIFAFQRIQQVYRLNLFRIPIIWPQLSSSLLCITTSKVLYFRLSAMSLLNTLVPITLHYIKLHPQILDNRMTTQNHELMILQPWVNLASCQFQEIRMELAVAVNKIIIDYGHILESGWESILEIVKRTKDIKSLQAIVETYLDKISENIMETIRIIDQVQRSLQDMNQKYLCLTLIWAIGDHCHKNEQPQALRKIYQILLQPQQMFVLGMQARHSSFYIFAQIIVHNCSEKEEDFWKWIFSEITNYYKYAMRKCLERRESANCEEQLKNILTNLIKIYRRLFSVSKEFPTNTLILSQLDNFYRLSSDMLQFRQSQIYQMILKQAKEILIMKPAESLTRQQFWRFLQSLNQIYFVQNDNKILKCLITYLPNEIYQIVGRALPEVQNKLYVVYHLVEKVFLLRLEAEEKDIRLNQLRIFFQEKNFLELFRKLHTQVMRIDTPTQPQKLFLSLYLDYLIKTNHKLLLYEDYYYLHKFINFLSSLLQKYCAYFELKDSIQFFKKIIELKFDENWIKKHSGSKDVPVWYFATQELIKQGYRYSALRLQAPYTMVYTILLSTTTLTSELTTHNSPLLLSYSPPNLPLFYQNHLEVLNFLTQCYFLNENFPVQHQVIQKVCEGLEKEAAFDQSDKTNKGKNSYQLMFRMAGRRKGGEEEGKKGKEEKEGKGFYDGKGIVEGRQAVMVRWLFVRVLRSFDQYFSALRHKQSALTASSVKQNPSSSIKQNPISTLSNPIIQISLQKCQQQIKFILKRLLTFQLHPTILLNPSLTTFLNKNYLQIINPNCIVLKSQLSHLFYFNTCIAKCVRSDNPEVREVVGEIFEKMGEFVMGVE